MTRSSIRLPSKITVRQAALAFFELSLVPDVAVYRGKVLTMEQIQSSKASKSLRAADVVVKYYSPDHYESNKIRRGTLLTMLASRLGFHVSDISAEVSADELTALLEADKEMASVFDEEFYKSEEVSARILGELGMEDTSFVYKDYLIRISDVLSSLFFELVGAHLYVPIVFDSIHWKSEDGSALWVHGSFRALLADRLGWKLASPSFAARSYCLLTTTAKKELGLV